MIFDLRYLTKERATKDLIDMIIQAGTDFLDSGGDNDLLRDRFADIDSLARLIKFEIEE